MSLLCMIFALTACGNSSNNGTAGTNDPEENDPVSEKGSAPDLSGSWVEKGKEGSDSYQAGFIEDGTIEIYWMSENGTVASLYWAGSYEAPDSPADEYSWDSANDKIKTQYALLASSDDSKTFTYRNGELTYSVTALGVTKSVSLERSPRDYTQFRNNSGASGPAQDGKPVELTTSRYWVIPGSYGNTLYYAVQIHNPNEKYAIEFPTIHITARAADGSILTTEEQTLSSIAAADTITYGSFVSYQGAIAETVELYVDNNDNANMYQDGSKAIRQSDLAISNVTEKPGTIGTTYTGEVTNNSTIDMSMVSIIVIYKKDGQMYGGETTYVDNLRSGESRPFELSSLNNPDHDSFEVYALNW